MDLEKGEKHVVNFDVNATTEGGKKRRMIKKLVVVRLGFWIWGINKFM